MILATASMRAVGGALVLSRTIIVMDSRTVAAATGPVKIQMIPVTSNTRAAAGTLVHTRTINVLANRTVAAVAE